MTPRESKSTRITPSVPRRESQLFGFSFMAFQHNRRDLPRLDADSRGAVIPDPESARAIGVERRFCGTHTAPLIAHHKIDQGSTGASPCRELPGARRAGSFSRRFLSWGGGVLLLLASLVTVQARHIRAGDVTGVRGKTVLVPIVLSAEGNEIALGLSLCFDTNLLSFDSVRRGADATGTSLLINTNSPAMGPLMSRCRGPRASWPGPRSRPWPVRS